MNKLFEKKWIKDWGEKGDILHLSYVETSKGKYFYYPNKGSSICGPGRLEFIDGNDQIKTILIENVSLEEAQHFVLKDLRYKFESEMKNHLEVLRKIQRPEDFIRVTSNEIIIVDSYTGTNCSVLAFIPGTKTEKWFKHVEWTIIKYESDTTLDFVGEFK